MTIEQMYMENIMDHFKSPRNYGKLDKPTITHHDNNPLCGDELTFQLIIHEGKVSDVKFMGHGCAISQASASMLTEKIKGVSVEDVKKLTKEDIFEMLGIPLSPVRMKCALLSLQVLTAGVAKYSYQL